MAIQKSIREGFGLIVSETQWKGTALVAGAPAASRSSSRTARADGSRGRSTSSRPAYWSCWRTRRWLRELGVAGIRRVRERFLLPRLLADQLRLLSAVVR